MKCIVWDCPNETDKDLCIECQSFEDRCNSRFGAWRMVKYDDKTYCDYWACKREQEPIYHIGTTLFGFSVDFDLCKEHYDYFYEIKKLDKDDKSLFGNMKWF